MPEQGSSQGVSSIYYKVIASKVSNVCAGVLATADASGVRLGDIQVASSASALHPRDAVSSASEAGMTSCVGTVYSWGGGKGSGTLGRTLDRSVGNLTGESGSVAGRRGRASLPEK